MASLQVTTIWQKTWDAINERNADGSRRYRYIIHIGSSRSSKTYSIIDCLDMYARSEDGKRITIWRNTQKDTRATVLVDMLKRLKTTGRFGVAHTYHKTTGLFTYATESTIEMNGTDDIDTVMGLTQDVTWLNEPYKISRDIFDQLDQRTSDFIIVDLNPKKAHWADNLAKDSKAIVIRSTFKDNPFCPPGQRAKILSYQSVKFCDIVTSGALDEHGAKAYSITENELGFTDKQLTELSRCRENEYKNSASDFNWQVYGLGEKAEKPNRIFKFAQISDDTYNELDSKTYYGVDWGVEHPWAVLECKYYDGALYCKEINYKSENIIRAEMAPTELEQIKGSDEGLVSYKFNKFGINKKAIIVCDPNKTQKISALRNAGYTYTTPAVKGPGSVEFGIGDLKNMNVYYTKSSINFDFENENYSYMVDSYGITQEEPEDADNHLMDALRYVLAHLRRLGIHKKV